MHPLGFPTSIKICDPTKLREEEIKNEKEKLCAYREMLENLKQIVIVSILINKN